MKALKKITSFLTAVCVAAGIRMPFTAKAVEPVISVDGSIYSLSTEPYENDLGIMADARELAEAFGLEYSFDADARAFIMHDDTHGDIILMHNATEFYSGSNVFECMPYFYVENGVPMAEIGFFCEMFDKSCVYADGVIEVTDGVTFKIAADEEGEALEDEPIQESGSISGTISAESAELIGESGLDVNLTIKSRTKAKYDHYGVPKYTLGESYELGTIHIADTAADFSYDLSGYYSETYPCYTLFYKAENSPYVARCGYYSTDGQFKVMADWSSIDANLKDAEELDMAKTYSGMELVLPSPSGSLGTISWRYDQQSQELTLSGYGTVTSDDQPWSTYRSEITSIVLKGGNINIGSYAFSGYPALKSVDMQGSSTKIEDHAFYQCSALEAFNFGKYLEYIGSNAFRDCTALKTADFSGAKYISTIDGYAFYNCKSMTELILPERLSDTGSYAFGMSGVVSVSIPSKLTHISYGTFYGCPDLETVVMTNTMRILYSYSFCECPKLKNITIPEGVHTIYDGVFAGCTSLKKIELPAGIRTLGDKVFRQCTSLEAVVLPDDITEIPPYMFSRCSSLASIKLPQHLEAIDKYAFSACKKLRTIEFGGEGLRTLGGSAFEECTSLEAFEFPPILTNIGSSALAGCESLKDVKFNSSMLYIPTSLFDRCKSLESIYIPQNIKRIQTGAFTFCNSLKEMHFEDAPTYVDEYIVEKVKILTIYYDAKNEEKMTTLKIAYPQFIYIAESDETPAPTPAETLTPTPAVTEAPAETPTPTPAVTEAPAETFTPAPAATQVPAARIRPEVVRAVVDREANRTSISFNVYNDSGKDADVYAAVYDGEGRLVGIIKTVLDKETRQKELHESIDCMGVSVKIFVWERDTVDMLTESAEAEIE